MLSWASIMLLLHGFWSRLVWVLPECHCHLKVPSLLEMRSLTPPPLLQLGFQPEWDGDRWVWGGGRKEALGSLLQEGSAPETQGFLEIFPQV